MENSNVKINDIQETLNSCCEIFSQHRCTYCPLTNQHSCKSIIESEIVTNYLIMMDFVNKCYEECTEYCNTKCEGHKCGICTIFLDGVPCNLDSPTYILDSWLKLQDYKEKTKYVPHCDKIKETVRAEETSVHDRIIDIIEDCFDKNDKIVSFNISPDGEINILITPYPCSDWDDCNAEEKGVCYDE